MFQLLKPEESNEWLLAKLSELSIGTLSELETITGINKGTISKYFWQKQRPSISVLPALCEALEVSPAELLIALGVMSRERPSLRDE